MVYEPVPFSTRRDFPISREFPLAPGFQNASFFNKLQLAPSLPLQCAKQISRLRDPGQIHEIQFRSQSQPEETQFEMSAPSLNRRQALQRIAQAAGAASITSLFASLAKFFLAAAQVAHEPAPQARRPDLPTGEENAAMFRLDRAFILPGVWLPLPRNDAKELLLMCHACGTPRRYLYGWEAFRTICKQR
jgi:hypothetical protein